jgi:hypothetical protein
MELENIGIKTFGNLGISLPNITADLPQDFILDFKSASECVQRCCKRVEPHYLLVEKLTVAYRIKSTFPRNRAEHSEV